LFLTFLLQLAFVLHSSAHLPTDDHRPKWTFRIFRWNGASSRSSSARSEMWLHGGPSK
jgi:hypothetical protein